MVSAILWNSSRMGSMWGEWKAWETLRRLVFRPSEAKCAAIAWVVAASPEMTVVWGVLRAAMSTPGAGWVWVEGGDGFVEGGGEGGFGFVQLLSHADVLGSLAAEHEGQPSGSYGAGDGAGVRSIGSQGCQALEKVGAV